MAPTWAVPGLLKIPLSGVPSDGINVKSIHETFPPNHYCAKSGLTHFCAIKSPKSTDILLNMYFTDFHWIPLLPVLDSTNISS